MLLALVCVVMTLGLHIGTEAAAFMGPARNGLLERIMVTPGSSVITASTRSATASSLPQPRTIGGARAGTRATDAFWALSVLAVACGVHRMSTSCRTSQRKTTRLCAVACQAAEVPTPVTSKPSIPSFQVPTPVLPQPYVPVQEQLTRTPPAKLAPRAIVAQITEPRATACRATMVGGMRRVRAARSAKRYGRQRKAADRAAATSRAARRALGSRLQGQLHNQEVPPLAFDASRQRMKIQAGLRLASQVRSERMREIRSPTGKVENLNGLFTTYFYMIGNSAYLKNLACANNACSGKRICHQASPHASPTTALAG